MSLVGEIRRGEHDDDLIDIMEAVQKRRKMLSIIEFNAMGIGTRVRFNSTVRPTYLRGMTGKVIGKKVSKLLVQLDNGPVGRFGGSIRVPAALLEVMPQD